MLLTTLLVASLSAVPAAAPAAGLSADPSVSITSAFVEGQQAASKSELAARLGQPGSTGLAFGLTNLDLAGDSSPFLPLDGAGLSQDTKSVLALLLGLIVGFGTGHLIAGDKSGFVLFLIIDIVLWVVQSSFYWVVPGVWFIGSLASLGLLISHIIQGLDAYGKASGDPIIQHVRDNQIRISSAPGREELPLTNRAFSFSF